MILTTIISLSAVAAINMDFEFRDPTAKTVVQRATELAVNRGETVLIAQDLWPIYKRTLLQHKSGDIDSVIIGSSTLMGVRPPSIFGAGHWLNMALNSNYLYMVIGQADEYMRDTRQLRNIVIGMDWALGMPFVSGTYRVEYRKTHPSWPNLLRDSLSFSRTEASLHILAFQMSARLTRWIDDGTVELCKSGEQATSFGGAGSCNGIRADGSVGFLDNIIPSHYGPIAAGDRMHLLDPAQLKDNMYYNYFIQSGGIIPEENKKQLEAIALELGKSEGTLTVVMPPMLPGLARLIGEDPLSGPMLRSFRRDLERWSSDHGIKMIDLSESEHFGCEANDFGDGHHSLTSCWNKISSFYSDHKPILGR